MRLVSYFRGILYLDGVPVKIQVDIINRHVSTFRTPILKSRLFKKSLAHSDFKSVLEFIPTGCFRVMVKSYELIILAMKRL